MPRTNQHTVKLYCMRVYDNVQKQEYELLFDFENTKDIDRVADIKNIDISNKPENASLLLIVIPYSSIDKKDLPTIDDWYDIPMTLLTNLTKHTTYTDNDLMLFQLKQI